MKHHPGNNRLQWLSTISPSKLRSIVCWQSVSYQFAFTSTTWVAEDGQFGRRRRSSSGDMPLRQVAVESVIATEATMNSPLRVSGPHYWYVPAPIQSSHRSPTLSILGMFILHLQCIGYLYGKWLAVVRAPTHTCQCLPGTRIHVWLYTSVDTCSAFYFFQPCQSVNTWLIFRNRLFGTGLQIPARNIFLFLAANLLCGQYLFFCFCTTWVIMTTGLLLRCPVAVKLIRVP